MLKNTLIAIAVFALFINCAHAQNGFSVMTLNIHGNAGWGGLTNTEKEKLGEIINGWGYDIINIQEDWRYYGVGVFNTLESPKSTRKGLVDYDYKSKPQEVFQFLWNDGLNTFSKLPFDSQRHKQIADLYEIDRARFPTGCVSYKPLIPLILAEISDCGATKGWSRATIELSDNALIDVYNLHTQSGNQGDGCNNGNTKADKSEAAKCEKGRMKQLLHLAMEINKSSSDKPVIIMGDTNLGFGGQPILGGTTIDWNDNYDRFESHIPLEQGGLGQILDIMALKTFMDITKTKDAFSEAHYDESYSYSTMGVRTDRILYRGSENIDLKLVNFKQKHLHDESKGECLTKTDEGWRRGEFVETLPCALSDHEPICAEFTWEQKQP